jgi:hypothetical protein
MLTKRFNLKQIRKSNVTALKLVLLKTGKFLHFFPRADDRSERDLKRALSPDPPKEDVKRHRADSATACTACAGVQDHTFLCRFKSASKPDSLPDPVFIDRGGFSFPRITHIITGEARLNSSMISDEVFGPSTVSLVSKRVVTAPPPEIRSSLIDALADALTKRNRAGSITLVREFTNFAAEKLPRHEHYGSITSTG